jgi:hypothetical protein
VPGFEGRVGEDPGAGFGVGVGGGEFAVGHCWEGEGLETSWKILGEWMGQKGGRLTFVFDGCFCNVG